MSAFAFESITAAQALAYNAATDSLSFAAGVTARQTSFDFNPNGTVSATLNGRTVVFGGGIFGETDFIFSDGSRVILGTPGDDLLVGATTEDALFGGPGNDTLAGGAGRDLMVGGTGADLYLISGSYDYVRGWEAADRLSFVGGVAGTAGNYTELPGHSALAQTVNDAAANGRYVVHELPVVLNQMEVGTAAPGASSVTDRAILEGRTLADIDFSQIVKAPVIALPAPPQISTGAPDAFHATAPAAPGSTGTFAARAGVAGNMDLANLQDIEGGYGTASSTQIDIASGTARLTLSGSGFTFDQKGNLVSGTVRALDFAGGGVDRPFTISFTINEIPAPVSELQGSLTQQFFGALLAGNDRISGSPSFTGSPPLPGVNLIPGADLLRGYDGDDTISGAGGDDTIFGGTGNDVIRATTEVPRNPETGTTYLRGEDGDDFIVGGVGFDDAHGNAGNDTVTTGAGDDYCVGGKDNDLLYGEAGQDLVYGNLGDDSCEGGEGADIVRGGQGNDIVRGGAGDDYVSGDRGDDTMGGGSGADVFHTFGDAGIDRVTDFNRAEGDRVQLDPGTQYTVAQQGADTVISMVGGGQMVLVGVQMSTLSQGWIFGA